MRRITTTILLAAIAAAPLGAQQQQQPQPPQRPAPDTSDAFQWLEPITGDSAMKWVKAENAKTAAVLEKDPRFDALYQDALRVSQARDRIPFVSFVGGQLYNFWQDSAHIRGLLRRTTLASYRTATPQWTTVLDLDSLARAEKANWVFKGYTCAWPAERRCMVELSDGGEDAVTAREFDLGTRRFVAGGFMLPRAKLRLAWMGEDTLLVASEWTPGELTQAGYPFIVKRLVRGQPLASATEIFRGDASDGGWGVGPSTLTDGTGHRLTMIDRARSFFEAEHYVVQGGKVTRLAMPMKASASEMVGGQVIVQLSEPWTAGGTTIPAGAYAAFDAAAALRDPANVVPVTVFAPGDRESVDGVSATRDRLFIAMNHNVNGRVLVASRDASGAWATRPLALPNGLAVGVGSSDPKGEVGFVSVAGFLTPSSLWLADARQGTVTQLKTVAPKFAAARDTVEQLEATSSDGTKVPYFVVHPRGMKRDGNNATILNAYGGFEVSNTPRYNAVLGKLWLEHGGVFVLANIRGGGEFGPAWHEAGLKTKRQIIYDDFAAVGKDLIARGITSPRHLGIMGGSNGGLLMGVQFTQHPELWNAVDIQVPLLDMLRFEQIQAGASWVGEYGTVTNPEERAFLKGISPYHNVRPGVPYPEPLIWTTTKDDRVGPQHARKFAAKLNAMGIPYLFYEVTEGGHGAGANAKETAHTSALEFVYFTRKLMDTQVPLGTR